ncbi:MAG: ATP synthase F1 subunit gamma [bacterium]|nr:ATP synthase F1 subunit gamma [bacterium]
MISPQALRRRIRSVQNIAKICRAMEMIATVKLRRTQHQALASRPYTEKISQVISDLASRPQMDMDTPPLLLKRKEIKKIALVHVATDRGLCGGLNANLNRAVLTFLQEQKAKNIPVSVITVGRKARSFARFTRLNLRAEFSGISDQPSLRETTPISRVLIGDYSKKEVDLIYLAYPKFQSVVMQKPVIELLLPVEPAPPTSPTAKDYIYEPNEELILNELLPRFVEIKVYHAILELIASEQAARMVAMKNASDNSRGVTEDLTMSLNKSRQETITKEICDMTGGTEAIKK